MAKTKIRADVFDYIDSGACDEVTSRANHRDFEEIRLLPLCLRDVSAVDLSATILGHSFKLPIGFSPTAFHGLVHKRGEVATATVAQALGIPMIVSSMSSIALEELADQSFNDQLWMQTYIFKDRGVTKALIERSERAGYKAIVVTIGCPVAGKRDRNISNGFSLPADVTAANFGMNSVVVHNNPIHSVDSAELDPSVTWKDVEWLRRCSSLPVILKGIMNPKDVRPALDLQVSGIVVSNHGGRQLDSTQSTIRALPEIAAALSGRVDLLIDGGIRRGTDVLKAIALGADGVLLGRPVLWALAASGEDGLLSAVNLLAEELLIAMQLAGCCSIEDIRKNAAEIIRRPF